jgi:hypothetical protein
LNDCTKKLKRTYAIKRKQNTNARTPDARMLAAWTQEWYHPTNERVANTN